MTPNELEHTFSTMRRSGGRFCRSLAETWKCADTRNRARIEQAFPEYLLKYGPDGHYYAEDIYD